MHNVDYSIYAWSLCVWARARKGAVAIRYLLLWNMLCIPNWSYFTTYQRYVHQIVCKYFLCRDCECVCLNVYSKSNRSLSNCIELIVNAWDIEWCVYETCLSLAFRQKYSFYDFNRVSSYIANHRHHQWICARSAPFLSSCRCCNW